MKTEDIGNNLKKLRISRGFTQADLATKLGVTYQAVSNWENGKNTPDLQTLLRITEVFHVSVDELLLQPDPYEDEYEPRHWAIRFFVFPILLFPLSFMISQFFLFNNTFMSMVYTALMIDLVFVLLMIFIKVQYRWVTYLFFTVGLFAIILSGYLPFKHYFDLMELPYFHETDRVEIAYHFQDSLPQTLTFTYNNADIAIMYNPGNPDIYLYNISKDINDIETVISTSGNPVIDIEKVGNVLYYISYDDTGNLYTGPTNLYKINLSDLTTTLVMSDSIPYKLTTDNTDLYLYTQPTSFTYETSDVYKLEGTNLTLVQKLGFRVIDIIYNDFVFNVSAMNPDNSTNIYMYDDMFVYNGEYFNTPEQDPFYLVKEQTRLLTTYQGQIVHLLGIIQQTGYYAEAENIHDVGDLYYLYSGTLLDSNFNELSQHAFYQKNWQKGDGQFMFSNQDYNKYIVVDDETLYQLERVSRQVDNLLIPSYARHVLLFISIPVISLIVTSGLRISKRG